jgi:hypothetical protein
MGTGATTNATATGTATGNAGKATVPWILLALNGGDAPLTVQLQQHISQLTVAGLCACFSTNLHTPPASLRHLFQPLPLGLPKTGPSSVGFEYEALIQSVRSKAPPWEARDPRLLISPMRLSSRLRTKYLHLLATPAYSQLVRVVTASLGLAEFLTLICQHRALLSPPGKGFDCFRTWQALSVGTVPLVAAEPRYDERLYAETGVVVLPRPDELTASRLEELLAKLQHPGPYAHRLEVGYWRAQWEALLSHR